MHFRRTWSRLDVRGALDKLSVAVAAAASTFAVVVARPARAEPRSAIDLEPVTAYFSSNDVGRTQVSVLSYTYGYRSGGLVPFVGGGIGFFTLQTRLGISWLIGDLEEPNPMLRLDFRPQLRFGDCWEPMLLGSIGVGYRIPLEHGEPDAPGTAIYFLPQFTGGDAFLHVYCGTPQQTPLHGIGVYGGTISGGFDW